MACSSVRRAPEISFEEIRAIVQREYGLSVGQVSRLPGNVDRNYKLHVDGSGQQFVLKVLNEGMSESSGAVVDGILSLMEHVEKKGIPVPNVQRRLDGKLWHFVSIEGQKLAAFMCTFMEGVLLHERPKTEQLLHSLGALLGQYHLAVGDFSNDAFEGHRTLWALDQLEHMAKYVPALPSEEKRCLVDSVMKAFVETVVPVAQSLPHAVIHSDFNAENVLCLPSDKESKSEQVSALLDFFDSHYPCQLFDIAALILYMMLEDNLDVPLFDTGKHILTGYSAAYRLLTAAELQHLSTSVCARLAQSLTLGWHTYQRNKSNDEQFNTYVLMTDKSGGWTLLDTLWDSVHNCVAVKFRNSLY